MFHGRGALAGGSRKPIESWKLEKEGVPAGAIAGAATIVRLFLFCFHVAGLSKCLI